MLPNAKGTHRRFFACLFKIAKTDISARCCSLQTRPSYPFAPERHPTRTEDILAKKQRWKTWAEIGEIDWDIRRMAAILRVGRSVHDGDGTCMDRQEKKCLDYIATPNALRSLVSFREIRDGVGPAGARTEVALPSRSGRTVSKMARGCTEAGIPIAPANGGRDRGLSS